MAAWRARDLTIWTPRATSDRKKARRKFSVDRTSQCCPAESTNSISWTPFHWLFGRRLMTIKKTLSHAHSRPGRATDCHTMPQHNLRALLLQKAPEF
jgi:hypothetical protein